jgi:hypothetical protein
MATVPASASNHNQATNDANANFRAIFEAAINEYKTITKQDLSAHPFSAALQVLNSPDAILEVFQKQAQPFDKVFRGHEKLMNCLSPIVNILFMLTATVGDGLVSLYAFL